MKINTILAVCAAFLTLAAAARAEVVITTIAQPGTGDPVASAVNAILPVATIKVDDQERGNVLNGLQFFYHGTYADLPEAQLDLCIVDEKNNILWQAPANLVAKEDNFNLSFYVRKGEKKQFTVGVIRRRYLEDANQSFSFHASFYVYFDPAFPRYAAGSTGWVAIENNEQFFVWTDPVASLKDAHVKIGKHILGGFSFEAFSHYWWDDTEEFILDGPVFRLFTSGGKLKDVTALELRDETGALLARKPTITEVPGAGYALVKFPGKVAMPKGRVSLFVHGRVGASFRKAGGVTLAFVPKDQGVIQSTLGDIFTSPEGQPVRSRELTFGVVAKPVVPTPVPGKG